MERLARRLKIPCHDREWSIRAIVDRKLPDTWSPRGKRADGKKKVAVPAEEEDQEMAGGEKGVGCVRYGRRARAGRGCWCGSASTTVI